MERETSGGGGGGDGEPKRISFLNYCKQKAPVVSPCSLFFQFNFIVISPPMLAPKSRGSNSDEKEDERHQQQRRRDKKINRDMQMRPERSIFGCQSGQAAGRCWPPEVIRAQTAPLWPNGNEPIDAESCLWLACKEATILGRQNQEAIKTNKQTAPI